MHIECESDGVLGLGAMVRKVSKLENCSVNVLESCSIIDTGGEAFASIRVDGLVNLAHSGTVCCSISYGNLTSLC